MRKRRLKNQPVAEHTLNIYYGGTKEDWGKIVIHDYNEKLKDATIHYSSTVDDYKKAVGNTDPGPNPKPNPDNPSDNSASENAPKSETVNKGSSSITYNSEIAFPGKKFAASHFGNITISYNGQTYTAAKIKVNKKTKKIQITKISPADKKTQKEIKKLTKGNDGLSFTVRAYTVTSIDELKTKINKKGELKKVSVKLNGKFYKCSSDEYDYNPESKTITFKGEHFTGSYVIK